MKKIPSPKILDFSKTIPLSSFSPTPKDIERLPDEVLKHKLRGKAELCFTTDKVFKHQCFELTEEEKNGTTIKQVYSMLKVPSHTEKLFEGAYIENVEEVVAKYIFKKIIGYSDSFHCPCIVIRDIQGDVVDIIKYRPRRENYPNLPKYLEEKVKNKPEGRGDAFLYPFQLEMERLMNKEGFLFIGEGLKNGINALIRSVPFLSIESTSNAANKEIITYINNQSKKGIELYAALDGDKAGEKAFKILNEQLNKPLVNLIDFDSGLDFIEYIRKEYRWE